MKPKKKLYFAHPISTYGSQEERIVLDYLKIKYPDYDIVNPATMNPVGVFTGCKDCMNLHMKPVFFKYVKNCSLFVIWDYKDSCGIRCELQRAWELGKKIIRVSIHVTEEHCTLQEYHYSNSSREMRR